MAFRALSRQLFFGGGSGIFQLSWFLGSQFALAVIERGLKLQLSSGGYGRATYFLGGLSCEGVYSLLPWCLHEP
jgi:hypothetical protein